MVTVTFLNAEIVQTINTTSKSVNDYTLITKEPLTGLIMDNLLADSVIAI